MAGSVFSGNGVDNLAVRCFYEPVIINTGIAGEVKHQSDVRTFRSFNGTDTAVVGGMSVTDFKAGTFTRQSAWAHRA